MLLLTILRPVLPFLLPVIGRSLQHGHILAPGRILRIGDNDSVLQQTGSPNIVSGYDDLLDGRFRSSHQIIETFRCSGYANYNRDRSKAVFSTAFEKLLHDCGGLSSGTSLHAAMRFVNNEVQAVKLFVHRVLQRFPNREGASVALLRQITASAELLRI